MGAQTPTSQPVTLDLSPASGGLKHFPDVANFKAWVASEIQSWEWLRFPESGDNVTKLIQQAREIHTHVVSPFKEVITVLEKNPPNALVLAKDSIEAADRAGKLLPNESASGQFVEQLRKATNAMQAAHAAGFLSRCPIRVTSDREVWAGTIEAVMFVTGRSHTAELGLKGAFESRLADALEQNDRHESALAGFNAERKKYASEMQVQRGELDKFIAEQRALIETLRSTTGTDLDTWKTQAGARLDKLVQDRSAEFANVIDGHKVEIAALKELTKTDIIAFKKSLSDADALKAPASYWEGRAKTHFHLGVVWLVFTLIVAAGLVAALASYYVSYLSVDKIPSTASGEVPWSAILHYGPFALLAFGSVWVLRICVRSYWSHRHLSTEAKLRQTMVLTFLALDKETNTVAKSNGVNIALEAMFRPTQLGLLQDELMPPSPHATVQRIVDAQKL